MSRAQSLLRRLRAATLTAIAFMAIPLHASSPAGADRIELLNGSVIIGTFVDTDDGMVTIKTDFAGTLSIEQSKIAALNVRSPLTLQMEDGSLLETENLVVSERHLAIDGRDRTYVLEHLTRINPEPWELGIGYRHTGTASAAASVQRGNTVRDDLTYRIDTRWRGLLDRYTLKLEGELRETNRERITENWMVTAKYDRFRAGQYYWGMAASLQEDRFADLDMRRSVGPYLGRSFLDDTPFTLEVETGVSQIREVFGSAPSRDYVGLTWSVRSESDYLGADTRLYVDHTGVRNLADRESTILNTTVGLAVPLLGRIEGAAEMVLNYNSGAVENTEELDQTYRVRLGYTW